MKKKLTAMLLSIVMLLGILVPAYAADADATADTASTSTAQETAAAEETVPAELTPEQLLMTVTILMRVRQALPVEAQFDGIIKAIGELKAEETTLQLSSMDTLAIWFYTIERGAAVTYDETAKAVVCSWDYTNEAGEQLRISMNTETLGYVLTTQTTVNNATVTRTVTVN